MNKLSALRKQKGLFQKDMAKILNVATSTYCYWENGTSNPDNETLAKLADFFDVSIDYLLGRTNLPQNAEPFVEGKFYAPILGYVSAGNGCYAEQCVEGYKTSNHLRCKADEDNFFWLRVTGDSMAPNFLDGDMVLVRKQDKVDSGSVAVVCINGDEGVIKKIHFTSSYIELISYNPYYPIRRFEKEEMNLITICGKVVELSRDI